MRFDSRTRKIVQHEEHWPNLQNPWQEWLQYFLTLLEKLTTWGQYSGPWEGKQVVFRSARGQWKMIKWWISKLGGNVVQRQSQQQLMSSVALKGYIHIFILVYHLQHGYDFWTMLSHCCIWMNVGKRHPPRLTVGQFILKLKCTLHRMNMGDKLNIIDDANASLFKICFDKMRGIHREEHWAYNDEPFKASYGMHT